MVNENLPIFLGIAGILIGVAAAIGLSGPPIRKDKRIDDVRAVLDLEIVGLRDDIRNRSLAYLNREKKFATSEFAGWQHDADKLSEFALFGVKLLDYCATFSKLKLVENYPKIATNMVRNLVEQLEQVNPKKLEFEKAPWGNSEFVFYAHVTRLLAMYEYVGTDDWLKFRCHQQLVLIVPTIGRSLQSVNVKNQEGMPLLYQAVPRLCSNLMFDLEEWERDLANPNFKALQKFMRFDRVTLEKPPTDGVYLDDSWIVDGNVPSYGHLFKFYNFHERVWQALGFQTAIREIARSVLDKLMHPMIKFQPLGLVNNSGEVYNEKIYWDIVPSAFGSNLMPFIGLGVFKTDQFLFHVRVQRPRIAAFQIDVENDPRLGLGAMMMRKMYLKDSSYPGVLKWSDLKNQPGMLFFQDDVMAEKCKELKVGANYQVESVFTRIDDLQSFIGRLEDQKLMFWFNYYFFTPYVTFVEEMGVVTPKGVQVRTNIGNFAKSDIQFVWKDDNTKLSCHAEAVRHEKEKHDLENVPVGPGRVVTCMSNRFTIVRWKMMLNESSDDYGLDYDYRMKFKFNNSKYEVEKLDKGRFYVLKDGNVLLGGSASSDPNDSFRGVDIISRKTYRFVRNPVTMMYKPEVI